jgi:Zn-dependent M28 family amino/carboxypeptidase
VGSKSYTTNGLGFSPNGEVTARLVAVSGVGRPADFPATVKGAIALIERGTTPFSEKVQNAAGAGAVAAVVYNNEPAEFRGTLGKTGAIPALGVSGDTGQELLRLAQTGTAQVRVYVETKRRTVESRNVLARVGDTCRIVVGGHLDSVPAGPGANDNASGTATAIEAARALRPLAQKAGLCFMAFGGEELGLWGSRLYVQGLAQADRQALTAMVNLDMVGVGDRWRISGDEKLVSQTGEVAKALGIDVQLAPGGRGGGGGSDHASFLQAGIPAVFFYRMEDPNYHLATDQAKFVDPAALEQAGRMAVGLIQRLAGGG